MTIDLDQFSGLVASQEQGFALAIKGPDGIIDLGLTITVAGPDSERQRKARQKQINRRIAKRNPGPMTAEELAETEIEMLSEVTVSWEPNIKVGGKELACSVENAATLYRAYPFIAEQVNLAAGSRADFLKL